MTPLIHIGERRGEPPVRSQESESRRVMVVPAGPARRRGPEGPTAPTPPPRPADSSPLYKESR
jgi:hypothetical protein